MLNDAVCFREVYLVCGYTDLRAGIERLSALVNRHTQGHPFEQDVLFLFCGRRTDRIKGLVWERDGYLLLYKRLANGRFQWPRTEQETTSTLMNTSTTCWRRYPATKCTMIPHTWRIRCRGLISYRTSAKHEGSQRSTPPTEAA